MKYKKCGMPVYNRTVRFAGPIPPGGSNVDINRREVLATVLTSPKKGEAFLIHSLHTYIADVQIDGLVMNANFSTNIMLGYMQGPTRTINPATGNEALLDEFFSPRMAAIGAAGVFAIQDGNRDLLHVMETTLIGGTGSNVSFVHPTPRDDVYFDGGMPCLDLGIFVNMFTLSVDQVTSIDLAIVCNIKYSRIAIDQDTQNNLQMLYGSYIRPREEGDDFKYDFGGPVNV